MSGKRPQNISDWEFPGEGSTTVVRALSIEPETSVPESRSVNETSEMQPLMGSSSGFDWFDEEDHNDTKHRHKLGQLLATSISGNDITSSVLYVCGVCAYYAGFWAPICIFLVSGVVLFLFRAIYSEVVTALPVNGGTYTVLLNTTSKAVASLAACLTLLSYTATAVVGASVAISYLAEVWHGINQTAGTVCLIVGFALLNFLGIKDSARAAVVIFLIHMTVMFLLIGDATIYAFRDNFEMLKYNYDNREKFNRYPAAKSLFFGFSAAMLGITGFETSANYVEEQQPGVFVKTLRNMWVCVAIMNPLISLLSMCVLPLDTISPVDGSVNDHLLQEMPTQKWLQKLVGVDAFLVLAGSILTSYVGFTGLVVRMSYDQCLPAILASKNKMFGSHHVIIFTFCLVCISLYFITGQSVLVLSNMYAIAFLFVMLLFAIGCLILKYKRSRIRRATKARVPVVLVAIVAVIIAIFGNVLLNQNTVAFFFLYYGFILGIVLVMFQRTRILKMVIRGLVGHEPVDLRRNETSYVQGWKAKVLRWCIELLQELQGQSCIFFLKDCDIRLMEKGISYVRSNELTTHLMFVHIYPPSDLSVDASNTDGVDPEKKHFSSEVAILQRIFPKLKLDLVLICTREPFNGRLIQRVGEQLKVPAYRMFMTCPSERFPYDVAELGGVRLITR